MARLLIALFLIALGNHPMQAGEDWLLGTPFEAAAKQPNETTLTLTNGIVTRTFQLAPNLTTTALHVDADRRNLIRAVRPEAMITINGKPYSVGGLQGQPNHAFLRPEWLASMTADPAGFQLQHVQVGEPEAPFAWKRVRHHAAHQAWPPAGKQVRFRFDHQQLDGVSVTVVYELYDGLPCFCKWLEIENETEQTLTVDRLTTEVLALVEATNWVEAREGVDVPRPNSLHVETDFAFGGFNHPNANRHVVHWEPDPQYSTQVNYLRQTPCLLKVEPTYGPAQRVAPGANFKSYRTFELIYDSSDNERRQLALRKMYRTIAPWTTENPLMMHLRVSDDAAVRRAIDQCAAVGFEMVILSFGSGFNVEDRRPENLSRWKELNEYAEERGIELGGYSLLSSRSISDGQDIVSPEGQQPTHGNCPALTSEWGQQYFETLYDFYRETGFSLLEHDGSYPGDVDVTERLPLQRGEQDSRWAQWRVITDFYRWCRSEGIYLNVPDYYFLNGSNKCGMGYREVNWSLPREQQVLHTRQNIFDGTRVKTPSMGWMFVPLTEYHGGGEAATVEPLNEHLDHYERMLTSNLGAGVQACYRGPRLYDTAQTRDVVKSWVDWFKAHRAILESDIIHGSSRRADGLDVDWLLHANPQLEECGMLVVYNPLNHAVTRKLPLNLYYTGISQTAKITADDGTTNLLSLDRRFGCQLEVTVPAQGMRWFVIRKED